MMALAKEFNENFNLAGIESNNDTLFTYNGNAVGAIELVGCDPTGLTESSKKTISKLLGSIIRLLPIEAVVTQYYIHAENVKIKLKERDSERSEKLSKTRQAFLNKDRKLNSSRIVWFIEIKPSYELGKIFSASFLRNLFNSIFDKDALYKVKKTLSNFDGVLLDKEEFARQSDLLKDTLSTLKARLEFLSDGNEILNHSDVFKLHKFLATFNYDYLTDNFNATPREEWDSYTVDSDKLEIINYKGVDLLKINGVNPVYVRLASIIKIGDEYTPLSAFATGDEKAVLAKGNYVIYGRYNPLTGFKRSMMLTNKSNELARSQISLKDLLTDNAGEVQREKAVNNNSMLKQMQQELDNINFSEERLAICQYGVAVYNTDKDELLKTCQNLNRRLTISMQLVWESVDLINAYYMIQPCYAKNNYRSIPLNNMQYGAASLFYKSHTGVKEWESGLNETEEAFYILESDDGVPFFYSPKVKDKLLTIGCGATRSGKTFLKNCIASHFAKYNGVYSCIDVDDGSIPMANFFGNKASAFTLSKESQKGFNLFATAQSADDKVFINHMISQLKAMAAQNSENSNYFTPEEIELLTENIKVLLEMKFSKNTEYLSKPSLSALVAKCGDTIKRKLSQFVSDGINAHLFDCQDDAIGVIDKAIAVYNLAAVKDNEDLAKLVHREIFFRIVRLFESEQYRTIPKILEIDEAQYTLSVEGTADFAIAKSRTWFKHGGGMSFWTQSPKHYSSLPEWSTLRSAASVFLFAADANGVVDQYVETFEMHPEEAEIIKNLKRHQQIYIKIPELNIAKVVNLFVEAEQYAICTSHPYEASAAKKEWLKMENGECDADEAISNIVKVIGKYPPTVLETEEELKEVDYYA